MQKEKKDSISVDLVKKMILVLLLIGALAIVGSVIYYRSLEFLPFLFGVVIGTASSVIKVLLLNRTVKKLTGMDSGHAKKYVLSQALIRYLLVIAALMLAALLPQINLWGAVIGVLAFQPAIYIANWKNKAKPLKDYVDGEKLTEETEREHKAK